MLERIMLRGGLSPELIFETAASQGFLQLWLDEVFAPRKGGKKHGVVMETFNLTLTRFAN